MHGGQWWTRKTKAELCAMNNLNMERIAKGQKQQTLDWYKNNNTNSLLHSHLSGQPKWLPFENIAEHCRNVYMLHSLIVTNCKVWTSL